MTDTEIKKIKERADAASAGPWEVAKSTPAEWSVWHIELPVCIASRRTVGRQEHVGLTERDARFIAAARTDVPALIEEVYRLQAELRKKNSS